MRRLAASRVVGALFFGCTVAAAVAAAPARVTGWVNWRGPQQNGTSLETGLPASWALGGPMHRWQYDLSSRGAPVVAGGRVFVLGYRGEGPDLQEVLACLDAESGRRLWERRFNDFLSDIIYDRYSIGSPTVDAETGNVYVLTSAGTLACSTADGKPVWERSLMEDLGRLTFPNGRTGSPIIDGDVLIFHSITSNWGGEGPAMDRFYALEKTTGRLVWSSSPGVQPKDSSFSTPVLEWQNGKRVLYSGSGCGHIIAINARTGEPLWRYQISLGGVNSSVVRYKDLVIGIHNDENPDSSEIGRMVAVRVTAQGKPGAPGTPGAPLVDRSAEAWRNDLATVSSSPVIAGNRLYQVTATGQLCCVDADSGRVLWRHKLGPDQLHASPLYADGRLYVPLQNGSFHILKPSDTGVEELAKVQLEGNCLGAPVAWSGKIYVTTTRHLYCFGKPGKNPVPAPIAETRPRPGKPVALQILPAEVLLRPGDRLAFTVREIDANGSVTGTADGSKVKWTKYIPPTARVRSELSATFNAQGEMVADDTSVPSAGAFQATVDGLQGTIRGRILPGLPLKEDFEKFTPTEPHPVEMGVKFAYPPLPWIGARFKWEIRDVDGARVLAKSLDNVLFQRATTFFGAPDLKSYTLEADVMSDGNRRNQSTVGLINQRYVVALVGNSQELEVSSNHERIKVAKPFPWQPKTWYRMKTRVDVAADGSGFVRAKVWPRGQAEPAAWILEVPHKNAHRQGSPGIFGFAPQSKFAVYVDNISVTPSS